MTIFVRFKIRVTETYACHRQERRKPQRFARVREIPAQVVQGLPALCAQPLPGRDVLAGHD